MAGMKIKMDVAKFREELKATADMLNKATRPAAQAGAQIIYDRARQLAPVSKAPHMFRIKGRTYGPFSPGNLRDSIYQVFSKDNSFKDVSTFHVSWNADKAPYGYAVERGTSRAAAQSFIRAAIAETRSQVRAAIKQRYLDEVSK